LDLVGCASIYKVIEGEKTNLYLFAGTFVLKNNVKLFYRYNKIYVANDKTALKQLYKYASKLLVGI